MIIFDAFEALYWRNVWLLCLIFLPLILLALHKVHLHAQWKSIADDHLQPWLQKQQNKVAHSLSIIFILVIWSLLVIALAGPRVVDWVPPEQQVKPTNLMVIIDFSASMNATDVYPSRKQQAIDWLNNVIQTKPQHLNIGITLYAGHAFELMPPTNDTNIIKHFLQQLKSIDLPTLGNELSRAILLANQSFQPAKKDHHILILSDGDISKIEQVKTEQTLQQLNHQHITFIGFGQQQAVNIPSAVGDFMTENGRAVQTRLDSTWLKQMALHNHVTFHLYSDILQAPLKQVINLTSPRLSHQSQQHVIWHELYSYPLVVAILLLVTLLFQSNKTTQSMISLLIALTLTSLSPNSEANEEKFQHAKKALESLHYKQAEELFKQIDSANAAFGEGIACYRQNNFQCATRAFSKAAWQTNSNSLRANAVFNLANSYFYLGQYDQASVLYEDAKKLGFDEQKAQKNLNFSNALHKSLLQRIKDIKEVYRRAKWRAAVNGERSPSLQEIVSTQVNFAHDDDNKTQHFIARTQFNDLIAKQLGVSTNDATNSTEWIKTEAVEAESTAYLLNRLFEIELGIPAPLKQPKPIAGKRPW